tara:strand:- start:1330 stop:1758 length:429 start_codon:yes stop_codon:yes gene_type:complete
MNIATISDLTGLVLVAAIFGGMLFFALVVTPVIFTALQPDASGVLIRKMFPVYYLYMGVLSALATLTVTFTHEVEAVVLAAVAGLFWLSRQILMPRIDAVREQKRAEESGPAAFSFKRLHRLSVAINLLQILAVLTVLVRIA